MNWTGGARSRVQKKLKQRAQEDFFKKRRLQSTLEAHKTQWPEADGGQDVQRLKMFSRHIASSSTEHGDSAPALTTPVYTGNGNEDPLPVTNEPRSQGSYYNPEWLQVTCEESQGSVTIPQYDDDDGLIPGVDFSEDERSTSPQQCQPNFTSTLCDSQQISSNDGFPWPAVQSDEHPVPKSPPDKPKTPSVSWASRHHQKGKHSWSLQSSGTASCSSFTSCTSSYRGSPPSGSSAAMTVPLHFPQTPANTRELPHNVQRVLHSKSTPQPGLQQNTGISETPGNATSSLACQSFPLQTPALMRRQPRQQQMDVRGSRTPHFALQLARSVPESPMTRPTSVAGEVCLKDMLEKDTEKRLANFQQTSLQVMRTSQTGHQEKIGAFNAPCSSSSSPRGQKCHQTDVRNKMEQFNNQGINVQEAKGPQHSLEHKRHEQGPSKAHSAVVAVQDPCKDLKKNRSKTVQVRHCAETNTETPTPALRQRKTVPEIPVAPANAKGKTILDAPVRKDTSLVSTSQVAPKPANITVEYPSVSEMRNMDAFYRSAWVLQLQHKHQELLMEEIKAQILYKPADRFSIMSAFEDDDDPFMGHKPRSSSLPYRTLDEELLISTGSSSSSPASQDQARHNGTMYSTKRKSGKGITGSKDSSQSSNLKTGPAVKRHSQSNSSQNLHKHTVSAECTGHVARVEVAPTSSQVKEEATALPPLSQKESSRQRPSQENVSLNSDRRKTPSLLSVSGASGSECGTQQADTGKQCTPLSSSADDAHSPHSATKQQACANKFNSVAISSKPSVKHCQCGKLKVDKACQAQPDVSTVSTSYDA